MARTAKITLDGVEYEVHAFNLKELQEVGEIIGNGTTAMVSGLKILSIALKRATPSVADLGAIEPTVQELNDATQRVLELSGIETKNPQTAAPVES